MYDAILEDLEDRSSKSHEEIGLGLVDSEEDDLDVDTGGLDDDSDDDELDADLDAGADDLLIGEEDESWSDDPVRMYLTQMGEIPLLARQEEIALAKRIEISRAKFRRKVLECDFVMQTAVKVLRRVQSGELPFDRTVQVSVTDQLEKHQILGRLPINLRTLETLVKRNHRD